MIRLLTGPDLGVPRIEETLLVEWVNAGKRVVFSYARLGDGMSFHFAAGKESLRHIKEAIGEFLAWMFWAYEWCKVAFGIVGRKSIARLFVKCGFSYACCIGPYQVYMLRRKL